MNDTTTTDDASIAADSPGEENSSDPSNSKPWLKLTILLAVVIAIIAGYTQLGDSLTLQSLAAKESQLRQFQSDYPILVYAVAFGIYVLVTGLSLPGAAILTLVYGWYFGLARGVVLVSFASTMGATLAFLLSRYLLRETIQNKFGDRLTAFNENLEREGAFYLFTLRLIPAVPFFVINVVMGLTPMRVLTFWWVSQLGMLAGTIAYVYAGSSVPDLSTLAENGVSGVLTPRLGTAFAILGIFPLAARWVMKLIRRDQSNANPA